MRAEAVELYSGLLQVLAPGERIAPCMRGLIAPPELLDLTAPPESIGFPPALIPVWDKGSGPKFYGYWRHWFVPRQPTFVEYNLDASEVYEWGRTFLQLVGGLVLRDVEVNDGLTGEARRFLESVGFPDLEGFEELLAHGGDHPSILAEHVVFRDDPPLIVFEFGASMGGIFRTLAIGRRGAMRVPSNWRLTRWSGRCRLPGWSRRTPRRSLNVASRTATSVPLGWL